MIFRSVSGQESPADAADGPDADRLQFRRETGYTDPRSLLATLTRQERSDLYELAEQDVTGAYDTRQQEQAAAFAARLEESKQEAAARMAAWSAGLEQAMREDLSRAAVAAARLAIQVAEKIVRAHVTVDHGVLTRALETILFKQQAATPLQVFTSPADASWLADQTELRSRLNIEVVSEDRRLDDGDCRVRSAGREWDLTIPSQLSTLAEIIDELLITGPGAGAAGESRNGDEPRLA